MRGSPSCRAAFSKRNNVATSGEIVVDAQRDFWLNRCPVISECYENRLLPVKREFVAANLEAVQSVQERHAE